MRATLLAWQISRRCSTPLHVFWWRLWVTVTTASLMWTFKFLRSLFLTMHTYTRRGIMVITRYQADGFPSMGICEKPRLSGPRQRSPGLNARTRDVAYTVKHNMLQNTLIYFYYIVWTFLEPPGLPKFKNTKVCSSHKNNFESFRVQ
jgi:hypothetical protein